MNVESYLLFYKISICLFEKEQLARKVQIIHCNYPMSVHCTLCILLCIQAIPHFALTLPCLSVIFSKRDAFPDLTPVSAIFQREMKKSFSGRWKLVCNHQNAPRPIDRVAELDVSWPRTISHKHISKREKDRNVERKLVFRKSPILKIGWSWFQNW